MSKKKQTRGKKASIEDIYSNKHFVPPKEQNLETIFEEPRKSKDGAPILTSVKKYKRYLHFDPTQNKIQKRKLKAKKCFKKSSFRITRSSPKSSKCNDISLYILKTLGENSDDDNDMFNNTTTPIKTFTDAVQTADTDQSSNLKSCPSSSTRDSSCSDSLDTPKPVSKATRPFRLQKMDVDTEKANDTLKDNSEEVTYDAQMNTKNDAVDATMESPRRSCCIS